MTRQQPQPFKSFWWAALVCLVPLAVAVVNQPASRAGTMRLLFLPFPLALAVAGAILALNVNGNASTLAGVVRQQASAPFGVGFIRLVGFGVAVAGLVMVVLFATGRG